VQELALRSRAPWVVLPVLALVVAVAIVTAGVDREPFTAEIVVLLATGLVIVFAAPLGLMLTFVRTRFGWVTAVALLTALSVAAPLVVEANRDESSTAGLAYLLIPVYGTVGVLVVALVEATVRRRR
jgi:hypothetical protein